jgi:hypothetical protein
VFEWKGTNIRVGEACDGSKRGKKSRKSRKITVGKNFFKKKTNYVGKKVRKQKG